MNANTIGDYSAPTVRKITVILAAALVALAAALFLGAKPAEAQTVPTIDPLTLDLGGVEVGVTSDPVSVTITNPLTSGTTLALDGVSITGPNAADFTLLTPVAGVTLAPGESQVLQLALTPSAEGPLSASLNVPLLQSVGGVLQPVLDPLTGQAITMSTTLTGTGVAPGGSGPGTPGANEKPVVSVDQPSGNKIKTRKPTIIGTARDAQEDLDKADIKVFFKGKEVTNFTYDQATDKVQFVPDKKLKRGKKYTVRIMATDTQGLSTNAEKTFKVKKR